MIEQQAIVIAQRGDSVEVEPLRQQTCGQCSAQGACGTSLLDQFLGRRPLRLTLINSIGARPGERVVVGMPEQVLLRAALSAYLVPLLALLAGGIVGGELTAWAGLPAVEAASIGGALAGLVLAMRWLRRYSIGLAVDARWRAVLLRRVDPHPAGVPVKLG
ncbi:SoxR reducing system RseC family protein [Thiohalocapsa marina]|uniref:SoxR reducing system RseC family protein n=1 Tax=Thiohalocapsa marina TaxID=424902 RepID=A0A5M8FLZ7_9GAMM|nr:SoxR reducing system RseC family protein [Thiohalocapsa marina]KAA6185757.1 SoxR reducing system RseC family protein [Thiohalocapsa marina]